MGTPRIVAISGSFSRPSKTTSLVQHVAERISDRYGFDSVTYDMVEVGPSLGNALWRKQLDDRAQHVFQEIVEADILVVGAPTYKGSYPGLFKHLIDLIEPHELKSKPILITATGGGDRHALMVEHQLRPLFGFFMAHTLPTAVYASDRDFVDYAVSSEQLGKRIDEAVSEVGAFFPTITANRAAAE
ncbi:FMN reductase [Rhizobium viscosum]|uniref:FMN reductase n=1 Tax=Rhizobium viscosum TaxID=1673 RepID=A0ABR9IYE4_RHIVS|nr:FMN reductase [Rhizobium viscosum]MBE1508239.1 FMN reductase [Rhizobium viscosum]